MSSEAVETSDLKTRLNGITQSIDDLPTRKEFVALEKRLETQIDDLAVSVQRNESERIHIRLDVDMNEHLVTFEENDLYFGQADEKVGEDVDVRPVNKKRVCNALRNCIASLFFVNHLISAIVRLLMDPQLIRNFYIIAHIDHGKSTLADRMLEVTGTIEARKMRDQVLDNMELERERGITIKMQPVRMKHKANGQEYVLNLIDTPGHIDFSYEVSRAFKAVEGSILLVDATQGVQAQTLTTLNMAREAGLVIIPVVSKIDSPLARTDEVILEVAQLLECDPASVLKVSGKTGEGVAHLLEEVIKRVPSPNAPGEQSPGPMPV